MVSIASHAGMFVWQDLGQKKQDIDRTLTVSGLHESQKNIAIELYRVCMRVRRIIGLYRYRYLV